MSELLRGTVKWFNNAKGFGFIEHESGRDVFVHYSVIQTDGFKTLKDGEEVHYELSEGDKGLHAAKVFRLKDASQKAEQPEDQEAAPSPIVESEEELRVEVTKEDGSRASHSDTQPLSDAHSVAKEY